MKTIIVIAFCLISTSCIAQRLAPLKGPALDVPEAKTSPYFRTFTPDFNAGTELPAMVFPDEAPTRWGPAAFSRGAQRGQVSASYYNAYPRSETINTNDFQMILHVDSSHGSPIELLLPREFTIPLLENGPFRSERPLIIDPPKK